MGIFNKILGLASQAVHIRPAMSQMPLRACSSQLSNGIPVKLVCNEMEAIKAVKQHYAEKHIPFTDLDVAETIYNWGYIKQNKANVTEKELLSTMERVRAEAFAPYESRMQSHLRYT